MVLKNKWTKINENFFRTHTKPTHFDISTNRTARNEESYTLNLIIECWSFWHVLLNQVRLFRAFSVCQFIWKMFEMKLCQSISKFMMYVGASIWIQLPLLFEPFGLRGSLSLCVCVCVYTWINMQCSNIVKNRVFSVNSVIFFTEKKKLPKLPIVQFINLQSVYLCVNKHWNLTCQRFLPMKKKRNVHNFITIFVSKSHSLYESFFQSMCLICLSLLPLSWLSMWIHWLWQYIWNKLMCDWMSRSFHMAYAYANTERTEHASHNLWNFNCNKINMTIKRSHRTTKIRINHCRINSRDDQNQIWTTTKISPIRSYRKHWNVYRTWPSAFLSVIYVGHK